MIANLDQTEATNTAQTEKTLVLTPAANKPAPQLPKMYRIVLMNDSTTSPEFVIQVLEEVFKMDTQTATAKMMDAHTTGTSVVMRGSKDMTETRLEESRAYIAAHAEAWVDFMADSCELSFGLIPE